MLVPSFYCQDVGLALRADGVAVVAYADDPRSPTVALSDVDLRDGDALVVSNTFGLRDRSPVVAAVSAGVTVVEDHTHDPASAWALGTRADYAFASLRKWLPIPDGAVLWSGAGHPVPRPIGGAANEATVLAQLSGMLLKAGYLAGGAVDKATFRAELVRGEARMATASPTGMSAVSAALLPQLPTAAWRSVRRRNWDICSAALRGDDGLGLDVMMPADEAVPFAVTVVFEDNERREQARRGLLAESIYPAVLWPVDEDASRRLPGVQPHDADLARRVLSLHCDHRYGRTDMERVAGALRRSLEHS